MNDDAGRGITLGAEIRDTCANEQFAVEQLMHVFKSRLKRTWKRGSGGRSIASGGKSVGSGGRRDGGSDDNKAPSGGGGECSWEEEEEEEVVGIIGGESSSVSLQVMSLMGTFPDDYS